MDEKFIELSEEIQNNVIANAVGKISKQAFSDKLLTREEFKTEECEICGDLLPTFRMERGLVICVACQTKIEKHEKRYG